MGTMDQQWEQFQKWMGSQKGIESNESFDKEFTNHPLFHAAMNMNRSMTIVVNLHTMKCLFAAGDTEVLTGANHDEAMAKGVKFIYERLHPDDLVIGPMYGQLMSQYFKSLPENHRPTYRSYWDWRFLLPNGKCNRVVAQDRIIKHDSEGNMILLLSLISDINALKNDGHNHLHMTNGVESTLYDYDQADKKLHPIECPSEREMDVLRHISQGLTRQEIAEKLSISIATVKTHCQNTFKKLRTNDSLETINLLKVLGH